MTRREMEPQGHLCNPKREMPADGPTHADSAADVPIGAPVRGAHREKSAVTATKFDLMTIDPVRDWVFEDCGPGRTWVVYGREIREDGFEVVIPQRRDSRLTFYRPAQ